MVTPIWPPVATIKPYCPQNRLVMFTLKVVEGNIYWLHTKSISKRLAGLFAMLTNTELRVVFQRLPSIGYKTAQSSFLERSINPHEPIFKSDY